jgi:hypothetical protein
VEDALKHPHWAISRMPAVKRKCASWLDRCRRLSGSDAARRDEALHIRREVAPALVPQTTPTPEGVHQSPCRSQNSASASAESAKTTCGELDVSDTEKATQDQRAAVEVAVSNRFAARRISRRVAIQRAECRTTIRRKNTYVA